MTDIALAWNEDLMGFDIALAGGQIVTDDGLRTAIAMSLFTDARASADDILPEPGAERRGWWGNAHMASGEGEMGSLLWLLDRAKTTPAILRRAEEAARTALRWLIEDQIASSVTVSVERQSAETIERLALAIELERPNGLTRKRYDFVWEASA